MLRRIAVGCIAVGWMVGHVVWGGALSGQEPARSETPSTIYQSVKHFNRGCALLEQYRYADAVAEFEKVLEAAPDWIAARYNLALALLNTQEQQGAKESLARAAAEFQNVLDLDPANLHAWFGLGMYYEHVGDHENAIRCFEKVAQADPEDPHAAFKYAEALASVGKNDEARTWFEKAVSLDPGCTSAVYRLAMLYQRERRRDEALKLFERFKKLNAEELAGGSFTVRKIYGTVGKYYTALDADALPLKPSDVSLPYRVVFSPETTQLPVVCETWQWEKIAVKMAGVAVADLDGDDDLDLVLCGAGSDGATQLWVNDGSGRFAPGEVLTDHGVAPVIADVDNDGDVDLFVGRAGGDRLFLGDGNGGFQEAPLSRMSAAQDLFTSCARLIDVDSDGDVDLFAARFTSDGMPAANSLLNNNRDGTFTETASRLGIDLPQDPITAVLWNDWDSDRDIDLLFFSTSGSPRLWANDRAGAFRFFDAAYTGMTIPGAVSGTVCDYDGDGLADVAVFSGGKVRLFRNIGQRRFALDERFSARFGSLGGTGGQFTDIDNDGDVDFLIGDAFRADGSRGPVLLVNRDGKGDFVDASRIDAGFLFPQIKAAGAAPLVAADFNGDGRCDVLLLPPGDRPMFLWNATAGGNWVELDLAGTRSRDQKARSNGSAIGARVEVKTGMRSQMFDVGSPSGATAMPPLRVHCGLGNASEIDWLRIIWPDSVLQAELGVPGNGIRKITEVPRKTSSCPHLFAWNGEQFAFVADFGGMGGLGYLVAPGEYAFPDPTEYVPVPRLKPRDGRYVLNVLEPLEEIVYFDEAKLLAVDHPVGTRVVPHEMMAVNLAPPPFEVFQVADPVHAKARDHRGNNVTLELSATDRRYAGPSTLDPHFLGYAEPHFVELTVPRPIGQIRADAQKKMPDADRVILVASGWVEYGYSQTNYGSFQAGKRIRAPTLAVWRGGRWIDLIVEGGYPAGINHTMAWDITDLVESGDRTFRLETNMELYWDEIYFAAASLVPADRIFEVSCVRADLHYRGYPREYSPDGKMPNLLDYANYDLTVPFKKMPGRYTRYGDVRDLLERPDDMYVIMGPGDEVTLEFCADDFPERSDGFERSWILKTDSFCKDMDPYTACGETVAPLPFHAMTAYPYGPDEHYPDTPAHRRYRETYNTRIVEPTR
ncbi:hypothetical protein JCM19992_18880 [Thermostilla marina]